MCCAQQTCGAAGCASRECPELRLKRRDARLRILCFVAHSDCCRILRRCDRSQGGRRTAKTVSSDGVSTSCSAVCLCCSCRGLRAAWCSCCVWAFCLMGRVHCRCCARACRCVPPVVLGWWLLTSRTQHAPQHAGDAVLNGGRFFGVQMRRLPLRHPRHLRARTCVAGPRGGHTMHSCMHACCLTCGMLSGVAMSTVGGGAALAGRSQRAYHGHRRRSART